MGGSEKVAGKRRRGGRGVAAVAGAGLLAAACGTGTIAGTSHPAKPAHPAAPAAAAQPPATEAPTTTAAPPTTTSPPPTTTIPPTTTTAAPPPAPSTCAASDVSATFAVVPGGQSAGHTIYVLQLRNASETPCTVSGLPGMQLLDAAGGRLPTSVSENPPGPADTVTLQPGDSAYSAAWFSPDVPGVGEPADGMQCEPTAASVQVSWSGSDGSVTTAVAPATPVCEHGSLPMSELSGTYPPNV